jgi:hypothetical protein
MKKYYLMAICKGDYNAMYKMGRYHHNASYDKIQEYYLMTIFKGNFKALIIQCINWVFIIIIIKIMIK